MKYYKLVNENSVFYNFFYLVTNRNNEILKIFEFRKQHKPSEYDIDKPSRTKINPKMHKRITRKEYDLVKLLYGKD